MKKFLLATTLVGTGALLGYGIALAALYTWIEWEEKQQNHFYFE